VSILPAHLAHLAEPACEPDPMAAAPDADCTWAYCWPAGVRLSAELPVLARCAGAAVADLGCGRGHGGLSALVAGAARVAFADGDPAVLRWVEGVLAANGFAGRARACVHAWGDPIPGGPYDVLADPRRRLEPELPPLAAAAGLDWSSERRDAGYTLVRLRRR
jgi:predicted nicotinamide N-methyase